MRASIFLPLFVLAACSESSGDTPPAVEAEAATQLDAGQWEAASEVTALTAKDEGKPAIDTPAGTKATAAACISEADRKKPAAAVLTGLTDECTYKDFYMGNGRVTATMSCTRPGLGGEMLVSVQGEFTATTLTTTTTLDTYLPESGDVRIDSKVSSRRLGECAA
jgi:hypothetical protein